MNVTIEEHGIYDRTMTVAVDAERVTAMYDNYLHHFAKNTRIPGFRPGKAPMAMVEARHRQELSEKIAEDLTHDTLQNALKEHNLRPVAMPKVDYEAVVRGQDFVYTATFQLFPQVEPKGYLNINLLRPQITVSDEDIQQVLDNIMEDRAEHVTMADYAAAPGDRLIIDFVGSVDGVEQEEASANDFPVQLGMGKLLHEFESGLLGVKSGENREIKLPYSDTYHNPDLAGKVMVFQCAIKEVQQKVLPVVDDELAAKLGFAEGVAALKEDIRNRISQQAQEAVRLDLKQQIQAALQKENTMDLPSQMLDEEIEYLRERTKRTYKEQNVDFSAPMSDSLRTVYEERAKERIILGLLVGAIADKEHLEVSDQKIEDYIRKVESGKDGKGFRAWYQKNANAKEQVLGVLMEEEMLQFIMDKACYTEEAMSWADLMKRHAQKETA